MKIKILGLFVVAMFAYSAEASASPVFSANGFVCGKEGATVTCKGPIPGKKDTVTGTGHDLVYLTVNTFQEGSPTRYTYFSDSGCLIGYTFAANGQPVAAVASHRNGAKKTFDFQDGKYEKVIQYCMLENPVAEAGSQAAPVTAEVNAASEKTKPAK